MASKIRKAIISQVLEKSTDSLNSASLSLRYNRVKQHVELLLPVRGSLSASSLGVEGVDEVSETKDKKGRNLVFNVNKPRFTAAVLDNIASRPDNFWSCSDLLPTEDSRKKILVEFSSPNIAKPFHMGHLRSTIIGNFLSNLHSSLGHKVVRINYLGDWGTQFGLLNVGLELGAVTDQQIAASPVQTLYEAYVLANKQAEVDPSISARAREIFRQLEEGSFPEVARWQKFRDYTVKELQETYRRLGVTFDFYQWESMFGAREIADLLDSMRSQGVLTTTHDGKQAAQVKDSQVTLVKSDGSTLYLTRDIAAARKRHEDFNFDRLLYVVDNSQSDHFVSLRDILSQLGHPWSPGIQHVKFGRVRGMSTRRGEVVFLSDILDEAAGRVRARQEQSQTTRADLDSDTADVLGVSAVIVNDLKQRRQRDYEFDWDKALQMQGDGGIRLQYVHCRLCSLEEKSLGVDVGECRPEMLGETEACALITEMARFDWVLERSYRELESCVLVNYLFSLSSLVNQAFSHLPVKGSSPELASQRLLLFRCARHVLARGMHILGLRPLNKM